MSYRVTLTGWGMPHNMYPPSEAAFIAELNNLGWNVQSFNLVPPGWFGVGYNWTLVYLTNDNPAGNNFYPYFNTYFFGTRLETTNIENLGGSGQAVQQEPGIYQSMQGLFGPNYLGGGSSGTTTSGDTYTVVRGDTFNRIAARFNITPDQLAALNPQVTNRNLISVGQVLRVRGNAAGISSNQNTPTATIIPPPSATVNQNVSNPSSVLNTTTKKDDRNWFDKTFFTGAGALTGTAIGVLVVLGVVVATQSFKQD